jgi:cold shock CspA family protein
VGGRNGDGGSKRLKGKARRWNARGFGFIQPSDGGKDLFCHCSAITDGNVLRDGDMVEYQAEFDDHKGNYRAREVTGGSNYDAHNAGHDQRGNILGVPPPILDRTVASTSRKAVVTAVVTGVVKTILGVPPPTLAAGTKSVRRGC